MANQTDLQLFKKASTIFNVLEASQEKEQAQELTRQTQAKVIQTKKPITAGSVRDLIRLSNLIPGVLITCPVAVVIAGLFTFLASL
jgi:hypothetical protein